jgi:hypothetical protein
VELNPQNLVIGLVVPAPMPGLPSQGAPTVTFDSLNHVFGEVASQFGYRNFTSSPEGNAGQIMGATPQSAIIVNPGLIQVMDAVELTAERSAEKVQQVLKIIAKHLSVTSVIQIGVKWLFHAPVKSRDAATFVREALTTQSSSDLASIGLGGRQYVGLKVVSGDQAGTTIYSLTVEPLQADETQLFIDIDAAVVGAGLGDVESKAKDVLTYIRVPVTQLLEKLGA